MTEVTLDSLPLQQTAVVNKIVCPEAALRHRLLCMGFTPGATVQVTHQAPLGDPLTVEVCSSKIALRLSEARHVYVKID